MDTKMYYIPFIMFALAIIGFAVMLAMAKRAKKSTGKAQQVMASFIREELPHMAGAGLHVIDTKVKANMYGDGVVQVIAYNEEDMFFIPTVPNPYTQKIKREEDEAIDTVPVSAITGVKVDEEKRTVKISVREAEKTFSFLKADMFGADHTAELEQFFTFMKVLSLQTADKNRENL